MSEILNEENIKKQKLEDTKKIELPIKKLQKILRLDDEHKRCNKETAKIVGDGVILIIKELIKNSIEKSKERKRKTLFIEDIKDVVNENVEFEFLRCLFEY